MPDYAEKYPVGAEVRIIDRSGLDQFRSTWHLHNPLSAEQLEWADRRATVAEVGFYHGGDPLYLLRGMPGIWHEPCLTDVFERAT